MTTDSADSTPSLANAIDLHKQGKLREAAAIYQVLLQAQPDNTDVLYLAGAVALQAGDTAHGIALLHRAVAISPGHAKAATLLASSLRAQQRHAEAVVVLDGMLAAHPDSATGYLHRAHALQDLKRFDAALASYDRSLALDAGNPDTHVDHAHCLLLLGRLDEGYAAYEWRKKLKTPLGIITASQPAWQGGAMKGKTLLLYAEQGLGDTIQYARYAPRVEAAGARVILAVQAPLVALMRTLPATIDVRPNTDYVQGFDLHAALMSLPHAFGTTARTVPADVPYLAAEPDLTRMWADKLGSTGFKVGIVWQGSPNKIDVGRSFPLALFGELARIPGVRLISLQKGAGTEQIGTSGFAVETLDGFDEGPQAFRDTAAAMMNLDLVITSDTAAAHLAGALARPTWLALKYVPDSRWGADGTATPWYPTARLFRQTAPGDWAGVFRDMADALKARLTS